MNKLVSILFLFVFLPLSVFAKEITNIELLKAIEKEFVEQGIANMVELEIFGGKTDFDVKNAKETKILISNLDTDVDNNKFTSNAEIFADGVSVGKTDLLGRFFVMKEIYVPIKDIAKDDIVKAEDFELVAMRENRIKNDSIINIEDMIGKQAVKLLKAGKLVANRDLRDEIIIKKGQEVMVLYKNKGLQITYKMEALEDGAKGNLIKFVNTKSAKEVMAKVIDKNTAEIRAE